MVKLSDIQQSTTDSLSFDVIEIKDSTSSNSLQNSQRKRPGKITVFPHLDSHARKSDGRSKFSIRVLIRGEKKYYTIGKQESEMLFMKREYWTDVIDPVSNKRLRKKRVAHTAGNSDSQTIERRLWEEVLKMENLIKTIRDSQVLLSHDLLKIRWDNWSLETFSDYCLAFSESRQSTTQQNFFRWLSEDIRRYDQFRGDVSSIPQINESWVNGFYNYLKNDKPVRKGTSRKTTKLGIAHATLVREMRRLGQVLQAALDEGLIGGKNPYQVFKAANKKKLSSNQVEKIKYLNPEEVTKLYNAYQSGELKELIFLSKAGARYRVGERLQEVLQQYLACVFTGFRFSDLKAWVNGDERCEVRKHEIVMKMKKTKKVVEIPISKKLRTIVNFSGNGSMFHGRLRSLTGLNHALKQILNYLQIESKVTWHGARHTFATLLLNNDVNIKVVSRLLGHSAVVTTEVYAKVLKKSLKEAVDTFDAPEKGEMSSKEHELMESVAVMIGMNFGKQLSIPKEIQEKLLLLQNPDQEEEIERVEFTMIA